MSPRNAAQEGTIFISRAGEDKEIAVRVAQILNDYGYPTFLQDNDFGHTSFMECMAEGFRLIEGGGRLIALLSSTYQSKGHCLKEARFPLIDDPMNTRERLIVLRIQDCAPLDFLKDIPYVDLVPYLEDHSKLEELVVGSVRPARQRVSWEIGAAREPIARRDPKIERLALYLENEDRVEYGKAILTMAAIVFAIGLGLIAFDYSVSAWNHLFGTSFYAIFDTSFVFLAWIIFAAVLFFGLQWQIQQIARTIERAQLTSAQLRVLREMVAERDWRSKWLVDAAISAAIRNITANR